MSIKRIALAAAVLAAVAACSSPTASPSPDLGISCGTTVVNAQTGIDVLLWQPQQSGTPVYVHQVTADWYGTVVTVKVDKSIDWYQAPAGTGGVYEVDQPMPPSTYGNLSSKGCKILSWR